MTLTRAAKPEGQLWASHKERWPPWYSLGGKPRASCHSRVSDEDSLEKVNHLGRFQAVAGFLSPAAFGGAREPVSHARSDYQGRNKELGNWSLASSLLLTPRLQRPGGRFRTMESSRAGDGPAGKNTALSPAHFLLLQNACPDYSPVQTLPLGSLLCLSQC